MKQRSREIFWYLITIIRGPGIETTIACALILNELKSKGAQFKYHDYCVWLSVRTKYLIKNDTEKPELVTKILLPCELFLFLILVLAFVPVKQFLFQIGL